MIPSPLKFSRVYQSLIEEHVLKGHLERNKRTGERIYTAKHPASFVLDLNREGLPLPGNRRVYPGTAAAELAWTLMGTESTEWLREKCSIWDKFVEEDGDTLKGAYGFRWRHYFERDQLKDAVLALRRDRSNRRIWITAWDPNSDGLLATGQKNVACPLGFSLHVYGDRLQLSLFIRSSDVVMGLPYDIMMYALLMAATAESVGVAIGHMHVTLAHPHIYYKHLKLFDEESWLHDTRRVKMPGWDLHEVERRPDDYVAIVERATKKASEHPVTFRPEVIV